MPNLDFSGGIDAIDSPKLISIRTNIYPEHSCGQRLHLKLSTGIGDPLTLGSGDIPDRDHRPGNRNPFTQNPTGKGNR